MPRGKKKSTVGEYVDFVSGTALKNVQIDKNAPLFIKETRLLILSKALVFDFWSKGLHNILG